MNEFRDVYELDQIPEKEKRSFEDDLNNEDLFKENPAGEYEYIEDDLGKSAYGSLEITDSPHRNNSAQRMAGGEFRREDDDGGHLIGARFNGSSELENIDAQNSNLNRGAYKSLENGWEDALEGGDKVFVNVDTYKREGVDRPDAYMGYSIVEDAEGSRSFDVFSYQNESKATLEEWDQIVDSIDIDEEPL